MQSPTDTAKMTTTPKFRSRDTRMTNFHFPAHFAHRKARLERTWFNNNIFSCFPEALISWWKNVKINSSSGSTPTSPHIVSYCWKLHREYTMKFEHVAPFLLCSLVSDTDRSIETLHTQTYLLTTSYLTSDMYLLTACSLLPSPTYPCLILPRPLEVTWDSFLLSSFIFVSSL